MPKSKVTRRSRTNPTTKTARLNRAAELTGRMDTRLAEVEDLAHERNSVIEALRSQDGASFVEIAHACGKSPQALHKSFTKA